MFSSSNVYTYDLLKCLDCSSGLVQEECSMFKVKVDERMAFVCDVTEN